MNILMLNYEYPPLGGGGSNFTCYLLDEFSRMNDLTVDLVTSSPIRSDQILDHSSRIKIHSLDIRKKEFHYWTQAEVLSYLFRAYLYCAKLISRGNYDLIHAIFGFPAGLIAYLYRNKLPYIISLRGSDVPGFNNRFSSQYVLLSPLFRRIWKKAALVLANSAGLRDLAHKTAPDQPIRIIPNGVDCNQFTPSPHKAKTSVLRILCVSRLIERKGIDYLIDAMAHLERVGVDCNLRLVGEGNLSVELKSRVCRLGLNSRVEFVGRIDHNELPRYYRKSDLFVLPSKNEGMSNTVLEAVAAGLPVIVTETGGMRELMDRNGIVVPQEDSKAIARAVMRLARNPRERLSMGRRSREIAVKFGWKEVAAKYRDYYRSLKELR